MAPTRRLPTSCPKTTSVTDLTLGEVLSFTPVHLEQAEAVVDRAVADALRVAPPTRTIYPAEELDTPVGGPTRNGAGICGLAVSSSSSLRRRQVVHAISIYAYGQQAGRTRG